MKVTVCEMPDHMEAFSEAWSRLQEHVRIEGSELILLNELPFYPWFGITPEFEEHIWAGAVRAHQHWLKRLPELGVPIVLGSQPVTDGALHVNRGFCWTPMQMHDNLHDKYYLPDEPLFYEACWFDRNRQDFSVFTLERLKIAFLVCTEVMFTEWARHYGKQGANLIVVPRASTRHERWLVAPRMAAIASGAFVLSSNRVDAELFGGRGLIIAPDGDVLAETSPQEPFITLDIDLTLSDVAKTTYPRDVQE